MKPTRCGFVALIGAPNAGKSTITNNFVGSKVSIVSPKAQTTRTTIKGIGVYDNTQIIFLDTPGIFVPKRRLDRAMVASAWNGFGDADINVLVVDAKRGMNDETLAIIDELIKRDACAVLAFNKIDLVPEERLQELKEEFENSHSKITIKCKKCGNEFTKIACDHITSPNGGCRHCYFSKSKPEEEIGEFIKNLIGNDCEISFGDRSLLDGFELDIYIPSIKLAFEFNGLYWHSEK